MVDWGCSPTLCVPSFKNLEGVLTILCALTQKRIVLNSIVLFWVSAQSIVKAPSKFLKLRFSEQVTSLIIPLSFQQHSINMADETRRSGLGKKISFFIEKVTLFYSQAKEVYNFHMARAACFLDTLCVLCNFQLTKFLWFWRTSQWDKLF